MVVVLSLCLCHAQGQMRNVLLNVGALNMALQVQNGQAMVGHFRESKSG